MATWQAGIFQTPDVQEALNAAKEKWAANYESLQPLWSDSCWGALQHL